jgi:hypothetical protein
MNKDSERLLEHLREALTGLDTQALFEVDLDTERRIEGLCEQFLKLQGFKVNKRPVLTNIKHIDQLVDFFYSTMSFYHGDDMTLIANRGKDMSVMSRFVEQRRTELECSPEVAIGDVAMIIKTLFENEKELNLEFPIGIWIFGTDRFRWITDRIISIINDKYKDANEVAVERMVDALEDRDDHIYTGIDFDELERRRKKNG